MNNQSIALKEDTDWSARNAELTNKRIKMSTRLHRARPLRRERADAGANTEDRQDDAEY